MSVAAPICEMPKGWVYVQSSGWLYLNAVPIGHGYAGGLGRNNPLMERVHSVGPIPRGAYTIFGPPFQHPTAGVYVLRLQPCPGTDTFGRSGFLMHGDNPTSTASEGCIVMPRDARELVWASGVRDLTVIASIDQPKP